MGSRCEAAWWRGPSPLEPLPRNQLCLHGRVICKGGVCPLDCSDASNLSVRDIDPSQGHQYRCWECNTMRYQTFMGFSFILIGYSDHAE